MAGLTDGLGYEELGQAGSQVAAVWVTGSIVTQDIISGTHIYATTQMQADNVVGEVVVSGLVISGGATRLGAVTATSLAGATSLSGTNIYAQTLVQGDIVLGDVVVSGLVISGGDTRTAGITNIGAMTSSTSISGANLYAQTLINGDTILGDVAVSGLVISGGETRVGALVGTSTITATTNLSGANIYGTTIVESASISGTNLYAQTKAQADFVIGDVAISGLVISGGEARLGIVTATSFADATGSVRGANLGSPTLYRAFAQAGSFATSAGSAATVLFGKQFATIDYAIAISPLNFYAGGGSTIAYASGTRNVSGCEAVGAASASYDYVAVGI